MKKSIGVLLILFGVISLAYAKPYYKSELIFPLQPKHTHSSSIVQCSNGDYLVCWFYGSGERSADDVIVQGARLIKGSSQWSKPFVMADTVGFPDCNPVLWIDKSGKLWLFWTQVLAHGWQNSLLRYRTSTDYLKPGPPKWSWQNVIVLKPGEKFVKTMKQDFKKINYDQEMWAEYAPEYVTMLEKASHNAAKRQCGWMTRIHPTVLPDGRILLPLYSDGFNLSLIAISDDHGKTWHASKPIVGLGPTQPSILREKNGTLVAFLRDEGGAPFKVMNSYSKDNGETWSIPVDTQFPNPSGSIQAVTLKDGNWILIYNNSKDNRNNLMVAMSANQGKTWPWKRYLDNSKKLSVSYPSAIQSKDGLIHITYSYVKDGKESIKYAVINEDWIKQGK
jgi:predicted neuraminidase